MSGPGKPAGVRLGGQPLKPFGEVIYEGLAGERRPPGGVVTGHARPSRSKHNYELH